MGIVIRFPNREPEELKHDKDRDVEIIMGVVEDLAWPACCLLLTAVMLRCLERYCGTDSYRAWQMAQRFARGLYVEIKMR